MSHQQQQASTPRCDPGGAQAPLSATRTGGLSEDHSRSVVDECNSSEERRHRANGFGFPAAAARPGMQIFDEAPTRVWCRFPGCAKSYASNDGVRKHAKRYHVSWLLAMDSSRMPVSDVNPPDGVAPDFDDAKLNPRKRARADGSVAAAEMGGIPTELGGAGLGAADGHNPSQHLLLYDAAAATLAGMALGCRPPLAPGSHSAALALVGARAGMLSARGEADAIAKAGGAQLGGCGGGNGDGGGCGGCCCGGEGSGSLDAAGVKMERGSESALHARSSAAVAALDPNPGNPRNPVVPHGQPLGSAAASGRESDPLDEQTGGGDTYGQQGFWTHSLPPIKRGPSLLNQIEDEYDLRVADPASAAPSRTGAPHPTHAGGGAMAGGGNATALEPGLRALSSVAAAASAAAVAGLATGPVLFVPSSLGSCAPQAHMGGPAASCHASTLLPLRAGAPPSAGGPLPMIALNPSETSLYLDVLDHAEPSAAGPALRRDNSIVASAAHAGRVPASSNLDEVEFLGRGAQQPQQALPPLVPAQLHDNRA